MYFGNFHYYSVKIGKDWKLLKGSDAFLKTPGAFRQRSCIPSAVVIMTTADGMHPVFSGKHPKLFIISYLYRVVTEIAEVHADIARSFLKCIRPLLP